jgi:hypothetical protein
MTVAFRPLGLAGRIRHDLTRRGHSDFLCLPKLIEMCGQAFLEVLSPFNVGGPHFNQFR